MKTVKIKCNLYVGRTVSYEYETVIKINVHEKAGRAMINAAAEDALDGWVQEIIESRWEFVREEKCIGETPLNS